MLQALTERDVTPDLLVGTPAGALNAVFLASHGTGRSALDELAQHWAGVRRRDVFPLAPPWRLLARSGSRNALCSDRGLRKFITGHLLFDRLEDAPIPVHVVATNLLSGEEVLLSSSDALSAVLASTAIPGVLPPVRRAGADPGRRWPGRQHRDLPSRVTERRHAGRALRRRSRRG
jgi:NTE family protein